MLAPMTTLGIVIAGLLVILAAGIALIGPIICLPWMMLSIIALHRVDVSSEKP